MGLVRDTSSLMVAQYFKRKRDAAPAERHRVDQSYFVRKYGVELPKESFEMPVWEGLWLEWSSENPARFHKERARRQSVTFRGLPERFAVTGNLKKWRPGEALEFFNDACRVDKLKSPRVACVVASTLPLQWRWTPLSHGSHGSPLKVSARGSPFRQVHAGHPLASLRDKSEVVGHGGHGGGGLGGTVAAAGTTQFRERF